MPLAIPPELKKVTPYVRRAEELDKDKSNAESRLVAYYCRQHAVHTGIDLATSAAGKTCLGEILGALETEKAAMDGFTRDEAKFLCRKFADKIFDKADLEDRTGAATKNTAKTFYAAASFLEILNQFYPKDDDSDELAEIKKRAVYGKWKATEILKAIKEGRQPTPGGYGEDIPTEEEEVETGSSVKEGYNEAKVETVDDDREEKLDEEPNEPEAPVVRLPSEEQHEKEENEKEKVGFTESEEEDEVQDEGTEIELGPPPAYNDFVPPPAPKPDVTKPPITFTPAPTPDPSVPPPPAAIKPIQPEPEDKPEKKSGGIFGFGKKKKSKLNKADFSDAMELTKFAMAALDEKNAELAAERLKSALDVLKR